jgi:hypothetical protein
MNAIAQMKTVPVNGPNGPANAIMIAVNIEEPASAESFISHIAEQFKLQRTISPPDASLLLITLIGDLTAGRFAAKWHEIEKQDQILQAYMSMMVVADVVQGTKAGQQLSRASLLRR